MTVSAPQLGKTLGLSLWVLAGAWRTATVVQWPWWWTAPTYDQVRHGFLNHVVENARTSGILRDHTTSPPLRAELINGGRIEARSWDNPAGIFGPTVAGIGSDEFGYLTVDAAAALSSRLTESRIKGLGYWRLVGNVSEIGGEAESMFNTARSGRPGWAARTWTWKDRAAAASCDCGLNGDAMSLDTAQKHAETCERGSYLRAVADRRARMSALHFRQLYGAEWVDYSALPAYQFDRSVHVTAEVHEERSLPLELNCDFNVDPMFWTVGQHKGTEAWELDEIVLEGGATTQAAAKEFLRRYPGQSGRDLIVYGDASGRSGSTKSNRTDYDIIRAELTPSWPRIRFDVPASNPAVTDRMNAVNALLAPGDGSMPRYFLHPRCEKLATDLARTSLKPGTRDLDKSNKQLTHGSDAAGYRLVRLFPIRAGLGQGIIVGASEPGFDGGIATAQF